MNGRIDAERILDAFLAPEADRLADRVIDAALADIARTPQRRAVRVPRRFPTMTMPIRLAAAAVVGALAVGGAFYLLKPDQPTIGGPSPSPSAQASATAPSPSPTARASATSGPAGGGSGTAHYDITGPDAASGDATFARSTHNTASDAFSQSVLFQDSALTIKIEFAPPGCNALGEYPCGSVEISSDTIYMRDSGWRATPLPSGPSCTWDTPSLTTTGGSGTVVCINLVNPARSTPNTVTITFTYQDPSAGPS
jgi:hypothetical protein